MEGGKEEEEEDDDEEKGNAFNRLLIEAVTRAEETECDASSALEPSEGRREGGREVGRRGVRGVII